MAKVKRLRDERDAFFFKRDYFGILTMLESIIKHYDDPNYPVSSDDLMYLQFGKEADLLEKMVNDPVKAAAFRRLDPSHAHLLDAAVDTIAALRRLHSVRQEVLTPHLRPDGTDVQREDKLSWNVEDRASMQGLSVEQQQALEAQLDSKGFVYLSKTERARLTDAIKAELE